MNETILKTSKSAKRGFGLIDVSLGIIAGIGLLVGAVVVFQQVTTNTAVSELTRNSTSISSEIRSAARNMESFLELQNTGGELDLDQFGLEPALLNNPVVTATVRADDFDLVFSGLNDRPCNRAAVSQSNLGVNVETAVCDTTADPSTLTVTYNR